MEVFLLAFAWSLRKIAVSGSKGLLIQFSTGAEAITPRLAQMLYHSLSEKNGRQEDTKHVDRPCLDLF